MTSFDADLLLFIQEYLRNPICDVFFKAITHLGDAGVFWITLTAVLLIFKKTRKAGIYSAFALIGSLIVNNMILKVLINRTRPYEVVEGLVCIIEPATDASFPSGHTGASFASAVAVYRHLPKPYNIILLVLAGFIAFSRLYVGIHYPTDVLGGLVTGTGIGVLVNVAGERISKKHSQEDDK